MSGRTRTRGRWLCAAVVVTAASLLGACGDGSSSSEDSGSDVLDDSQEAINGPAADATTTTMAASQSVQAEADLTQPDGRTYHVAIELAEPTVEAAPCALLAPPPGFVTVPITVRVRNTLPDRESPPAYGQLNLNWGSDWRPPGFTEGSTDQTVTPSGLGFGVEGPGTLQCATELYGQSTSTPLLAPDEVITYEGAVQVPDDVPPEALLIEFLPQRNSTLTPPLVVRFPAFR